MLAPGSGCFLASRTSPVSLPTVPAGEATAHKAIASAVHAATLATVPTASRPFMPDSDTFSRANQRRVGAGGSARPTPLSRMLPHLDHFPSQGRGAPSLIAHL